MLSYQRCQPTIPVVVFGVVAVLACSTVARGQTYQRDNKTCSVNINGESHEKIIGDVWNSSEDPCAKFTCEMRAKHAPIVRSFREYCMNTCGNDYDVVSKDGVCCGDCVKSRCSMNGKIYQKGEMWKSEDQCKFYECTASAEVTSYKKACPTVTNCPASRRIMKDCCEYCDLNESITSNDAHSNDFVHSPNKYLTQMAKETYRNHPCRRECIKGAAPMMCHYSFLVEWYETLSKACFHCPVNGTDCDRPHCIVGDGFRRSVLVVNRMMPGPAIEVCRGDTIIADIQNDLMGDSTSIHWHGLHQRDSPHYDGVVQVTQCPILPHTTFRYTVKADNVGTHWWHSHVGMQRADGAFGALLIREPISDLPLHIQSAYDVDSVDHLMMMQDWDHRTGVAGFSSFHHSIGHNKPQNILVNGRGRFFQLTQDQSASSTSTTTTTPSTTTTTSKTTIISNVVDDEPDSVNETDDSNNNRTFSVVGVRQKRFSANDNKLVMIGSEHTPYAVFHVNRGLRYRFRTINSGFLNCPLEISIDNHTMDVIASDGHYFETVHVDSFVTYAGERFDFVVTANQPVGNYWIRIRGLMDCDERFTKAHQGAILRYDGAAIEDPSTVLAYDYHRGGFQLNSLNRGTGEVESLSIAELTAIEDDTPALLTEHTDYKFFVYYDFYDKDFPHFNHPQLYSIQDVANKSEQFFGPQLNHISMKMPSKPLLVARERNDETKFCNASSLAARNIDCQRDFCECSHVLQVRLNATVEMVLIDEGYKYDANHPFHLHGHDFRVVAMERIQPTGVTVQQIQQLDQAGGIKRRLSGAPIKDTVTVPDGGFTIIRFVASNPGFWLLHCHIDFHVEVGMALVFKIGDYDQMKPLPPNFPTCDNYMPMSVPSERPQRPENEAQNSLATAVHISLFVLIVASVIDIVLSGGW